jgi:hypothetical protein
MHDGPDTHGAGFDGDIESGIRKTVVLQIAGRRPDGDYLCMCRWIVAAYWLIESFTNNFACRDQHSPDRNLTQLCSQAGQLDGAGHPIVMINWIYCCVGHTSIPAVKAGVSPNSHLNLLLSVENIPD